MCTLFMCRCILILIVPATDIDMFLNTCAFQESDDPYYVTLLASQTTHRAVLAGDRRRSPGLCDKTSEFIEEATRYVTVRNSSQAQERQSVLFYHLHTIISSVEHWMALLVYIYTRVFQTFSAKYNYK